MGHAYGFQPSIPLNPGLHAFYSSWAGYNISVDEDWHSVVWAVLGRRQNILLWWFQRRLGLKSHSDFKHW